MRRTIDAIDLFARIAPRKLDRLGRANGKRDPLTLEAKTDAVLRVLSGEPIETVALEVKRAPGTLRCWIGHWQGGTEAWRGHRQMRPALRAVR